MRLTAEQINIIIARVKSTIAEQYLQQITEKQIGDFVLHQS